MGSSPPPSLECLDLTRDPNVLVPGSEERKLMGRRLIEALETHGGVVVEFPSDEVNGELLLDETFSAVRDLFDLPFETKLEIAKTYSSYPNTLPSDDYPYYQALGVADPLDLEVVRAYTQVIWPHGNDRFSNTLNGISKKIHQVLQIILEMIFDTYGVRSHYDSQVGNTTKSLRMSKYTAPAKGESVVALAPHLDPNFITALYSTALDGLQFESKQGEWFPVNLRRKGSLIIVVGQSLEGWSNGRIVAPLHKVVMSPGDNDRYTCGVFVGPLLEQVIEAPRELVDGQHPRLFKPFTYDELLEYNRANNDYGNCLRLFAGI